MWQNSKTQVVTKLRNPNCTKTQKLKLLQNSKSHIVTKPKNLNCDKTKKKCDNRWNVLGAASWISCNDFFFESELTKSEKQKNKLPTKLLKNIASCEQHFSTYTIFIYFFYL